MNVKSNSGAAGAFTSRAHEGRPPPEGSSRADVAVAAVAACSPTPSDDFPESTTLPDYTLYASLIYREPGSQVQQDQYRI